MKKMNIWLLGSALAAVLSAGSAVAAEIKVGFVTSMSGPASSLGIPYSKGLAAGRQSISEIEGNTIKVIELDDASDPTAAARNARKLVEEEKVDLLIGSAGSPAALAMAAVASELKVPLISIANANPTGEAGAWTITVPQPAPLMVSALVEHMKKNNAKSIGYIGFSDPWGDLVYDALNETTKGSDIKIATNERFARSDSSVTAQALKIVAARPDVVVTGGSGTPGALPHIALAERGFKGTAYGTHAIINPDFVRVGGKAVEGVIAPSGPVVVAEQLPDSNPIKKVAMDFRKDYEAANKESNYNAFAAYSYDAWLLFADAAKRALPKATPGTPEYRAALKEMLTSTKEVVGTHAVYNFTPDSRYGTDERSRVLVQLKDGKWSLVE
ncbi:branched-chain amino acid ABC transporter substrate-binding protein (plasmid) [Neorhizobium sp. SOG26]|uniref:ABC transporter substrate-binding protein n=1 Tax=Neorhizobium sp. SOG26 TaxID=2060726 RepID=UPI000E58F67F|nr:ABC transporter substrate-binding protein [Neorhizobium sp. SOG26]AXV18502.1 branched-chain amino acid ABC transporter substrate-binding protein [Neorhizobium sp. SOG26]